MAGRSVQKLQQRWRHIIEFVESAANLVSDVRSHVARPYVLNLRIERAKALLCQEGTSIADVALQCGFSHQEHLTRMFRRFTGTTPGRYRGTR